MTSRQRILMSCNHKEPDRVPIDFGSMRSTGISAIAFNRLKKFLGYTGQPCLMYDFQQQLAYVGDMLRERFRVDSLDVGEAFIGDIASEWREWKLPDGTDCFIPNHIDARRDAKGDVSLFDRWGVGVGFQPKSSLYADQISFPYQQYEEIPQRLDKADYSHILWSVPCFPFHLDYMNSEDDYQKFVQTIRSFREKTDKAIMISFGNSFLEACACIRGREKFLCDIYLDRPGTERLMDALLEDYLAALNRVFGDIADCVDIVEFDDDLGTQNGPWMDPNVIRELFIPRYKKLWDCVHAASECKVFMHNCGSISSVLGYLIDAGLDIINPVQTSAANMDPEMLKRKFGKDIVFWGGGCETQSILADSTPDQVRDHVRRRIEILSKDGGFVFNQVHNILANVPPENIVAMYDAAFEFGRY